MEAQQYTILTRLDREELVPGDPPVLPRLAGHRKRHPNGLRRTVEVEVREGDLLGSHGVHHRVLAM